MKKLVFLSLSVAVLFAVSGSFGVVHAADQSPDAYLEFNRQVVPLQQQLYAKQAEVEAEYAGGQPDMDKVRRLYQEMGELKSQLFSARSDLRNRLGDDDWGGGYGHGGYGRGGRGYSGHHGGHGGHGGGHRGGWGW